ncbi:GapA-binding peptide SR1P [Oceanobacillus sp. AG]|uniref:GapA-binding peptide SR1P n=1 Tax=Oceanobacillus sp. AG TaxID=2681969 RepID=UPI00351A97E5
MKNYLRSMGLRWKISCVPQKNYYNFQQSGGLGMDKSVDNLNQKMYGLMVCKHCDGTIETFESIKVETLYSICPKCKE